MTICPRKTVRRQIGLRFPTVSCFVPDTLQGRVVWHHKGHLLSNSSVQWKMGSPVPGVYGTVRYTITLMAGLLEDTGNLTCSVLDRDGRNIMSESIDIQVLGKLHNRHVMILIRIYQGCCCCCRCRRRRCMLCPFSCHENSRSYSWPLCKAQDLASQWFYWSSVFVVFAEMVQQEVL